MKLDHQLIWVQLPAVMHLFYNVNFNKEFIKPWIFYKVFDLVKFYQRIIKSLNLIDFTLSDVGRGGQKGNKWEFFQKFSVWKVHFPRGLMDKALDFDTKGPWFKSQWELMVHITSVALFDAQRGKEMVVLLLEYH